MLPTYSRRFVLSGAGAAAHGLMAGMGWASGRAVPRPAVGNGVGNRKMAFKTGQRQSLPSVEFLGAVAGAAAGGASSIKRKNHARSGKP
jgi:hypothetical protein